MVVSNQGDIFVQAEDGIRDRVRSRGLGDVYKRQHIPVQTSLLVIMGTLLVSILASVIIKEDEEKDHHVHPKPDQKKMKDEILK